MDPIRQISTRPLSADIRLAGETAAGVKAADGPSFDKLFQSAVSQVETFRQQSQAAADRFLNGESEELHQVVLATQRAQVAFDLFAQVRNKVVQAYQEVMRMQM